MLCVSSRNRAAEMSCAIDEVCEHSDESSSSSLLVGLSNYGYIFEGSM